MSESSDSDVSFCHSHEAFLADRAIGEESLHLRAIQQSQVGLEIDDLLSRGLPSQAIVGAVAHEPIPLEQEPKPDDKWREIVRFEEEIVCRCLAIHPFSHATQFARECLLIFPGSDVLDG